MEEEELVCMGCENGEKEQGWCEFWRSPGQVEIQGSLYMPIHLLHEYLSWRRWGGGGELELLELLELDCTELACIELGGNQVPQSEFNKLQRHELKKAVEV